MQYLIYKIECKISGEVYVGSTSKSIDERMSFHLSSSNGTRSKQIIERGSYSIDILETLQDCDKYLALEREKYYMLEFNCVNHHLPILTDEERKLRQHTYNVTIKKQRYKSGDYSEYYQQNKQRIKQRVAEYRNDNKDAINAKRYASVDCACGRKYIYQNRLRHNESKYHQKYIDGIK